MTENQKWYCQEQGSIFGPLLFLLYINDIVEDIDSSIRLFADDTSLFIIVASPLQAAEQLYSDLQKIHRWATKRLVSLNPEKSESILLSRKHNKPFSLTMNQNQIAEGSRIVSVESSSLLLHSYLT